jgi:lactose/L-arabinose transport system ATP-binding protein
MSGLRLQNVVKQFGQTEVIHGVSIRIDDGEFVVFVGPSGCGKTTLLRLIAGLEELTSGEVFIGNRLVNDVDPAERGVAMVFQSYALYPHMSVEQNMGFGLRMARKPKKEIQERVGRAARILHLTPYLKRRPKELSGGQRQRVAIGRAIVREPEVFLFDEPLSNLDTELRVQMRIELAKLHSELETTMIYVTHDQVEAMTLADKIVVVNQGVIEQIGEPMDIYQTPANLFVAGFFGSPRMNFLKTKVDGVASSGVFLGGPDFSPDSLFLANRTGGSLKTGTELTLGIRPEHLRITEAASGKGKLRVEVTEILGDTTYLHGLTATGNRLTVSAKGFHGYKHNETVGFDFDDKHAHLFDTRGDAV